MYKFQFDEERQVGTRMSNSNNQDEKFVRQDTALRITVTVTRNDAAAVSVQALITSITSPDARTLKNSVGRRLSLAHQPQD
jgi:hypothetical protein